MLKFLDGVCVWGGAAILVLAPTQWGFALAPGLRVGPVDPLVALVAGAWGLRLLLRRRLGDLRPPPVAVLLFLALAALSAVVSGSRLASAKDLVQMGEYFVAGWLLFADGLGDPGRRRRLVNVFLAVAAGVIAAALVQYVQPSRELFAVGGTFGNRNVLGGFLALALPLAWAGVLFETRRWARVWRLVLVLAGLVVCTAGASLLALGIAFGFVAALKGTRALLLVAVGAVLWLGWGWHLLPRDNAAAAYESLVPYRDDGQPVRRYPEWQVAVDAALEQPWFGVGLGGYQQAINRNIGVYPVEAHKAEDDSQSLYLVLAVSAGLPALLCFVALLLQGIAAPLRRLAATTDVSALAQGIGAAGGVLAFALNAQWAPLLVRGIGLPLVFVLCLALTDGRGSAANGAPPVPAAVPD
jgi:O-antigen ligase